MGSVTGSAEATTGRLQPAGGAAPLPSLSRLGVEAAGARRGKAWFVVAEVGAVPREVRDQLQPVLARRRRPWLVTGLGQGIGCRAEWLRHRSEE